jgi:transposase
MGNRGGVGYPSDVSDDEWAFVAPYLTLCREDAKQREYPLRAVFNAVRWLVRSGAHWRMMPNDLPPWPVVYQQTQRWITPLLLFVIRIDRTQVQLIDQVADEVRQVSFWQPISQAGRQQQVLIRQVRPVGFSHARKLTHPSCEFQALSEVRCRLPLRGKRRTGPMTSDNLPSNQTV